MYIENNRCTCSVNADHSIIIFNFANNNCNNKVPLHLWSKDTSKLQCKKEAMKCWYLTANEIVAMKEPEAGCKFFKLNPGL